MRLDPKDEKRRTFTLLVSYGTRPEERDSQSAQSQGFLLSPRDVPAQEGHQLSQLAAMGTRESQDFSFKTGPGQGKPGQVDGSSLALCVEFNDLHTL